MIIDKILSQSRRDFYADYKCQFCNNIEHNKSGYDDSYFHNEVIPNMKCKKCGKSTNSENDKTYKPLKTKYPDGFQV